MTNTTKIIEEPIKEFSEKNTYFSRQGQEDKKATKNMIATLQNWIQPDIVGLMGVGSPRVIEVDHAKQIRKDIRI